MPASKLTSDNRLVKEKSRHLDGFFLFFEGSEMYLGRNIAK